MLPQYCTSILHVPYDGNLPLTPPRFANEDTMLLLLSLITGGQPRDYQHETSHKPDPRRVIFDSSPWDAVASVFAVCAGFGSSRQTRNTWPGGHHYGWARCFLCGGWKLVN